MFLLFRVLALLVCSLYVVLISPAHAEQWVALFKSSALTLRYHDTADEFHLEMAPPIKLELRPALLAVNAPPRLVVDLPIAKRTLKKELLLPKSTFVRGIRVGSHPDKIRVVLDLVPGDWPNYVLNENKSAFVLSLRRASALENKETPTPSPTEPGAAGTTTSVETPSPLPLPEASATPEPKQFLQPTLAPHSAPTRGPVEPSPQIGPEGTSQPLASPSPSSTNGGAIHVSPTPTPVPPPTNTALPKPSSTPTLAPPTHTAVVVSGEQQLHDIAFEYLTAEHIPIVRLKLTTRSEFKLVRKDEREFRLTVPSCGIGAQHLSLPQFPPHDFVGLTYIEVEAQGQSLEVRVGVERGIRIAATASENEIWIKALNK